MRTTSIIANKSAVESGLKAAHKDQIIKVLTQRKRGTSYHISRWTGIDYTAVARRMGELEREQKVCDLGRIGFSPTHLPATVWEIVKSDING